MIEDDEEQMKEELKEAFRIYDRDGEGFITTEVTILIFIAFRFIHLFQATISALLICIRQYMHNR